MRKERRRNDGKIRSRDGVAIAYAVEGEGRHSLLFVHGGLCNRGLWNRQMSDFSNAYRVVALDLAGHGDSGARPVWTLRAFAEDVKAVVEALELDRVVLIGHSMGGPVCLEAATLLPDSVIGVVGVESLHNASVRPEGPRWTARIDAYRNDFEGTCDREAREMFPEGADPELVAEVSNQMRRGSPEVAVAILEMFTGYDMAGAMQKVRVPIRSVNADLYPTDIEGNRRYAPGFDAAIINGAGHFLMLERPEDLHRTLSQAIRKLTGETR